MTECNECLKCDVCSSTVRVFFLGNVTVGGHKCKTIEESLLAPRFPLELIFCENCNMSRYSPNEDAGQILKQFYENQYSTYSILTEASLYIKEMAGWIVENFPSCGGDILEIGCNDGALLSEIKQRDSREVIGIEPSCNFLQAWSARRLKVINDFFNESRAICLQHQKFDIIIIRHVLEHISDLDSFLSNVDRLMNQDTVLIIESPYFPTILSKGRFENISYAHINHFTTASLSVLCQKYGWGIDTVRLVDTDGGSFVATLRKGIVTKKDLLDKISISDIEDFLNRMNANGERLREELRLLGKGKVIGYGAGAKGPHLVCLYRLDEWINEIVDDNESFHGLFVAGTAIKIVSSARLADDSIVAVMNLAPTHSDLIRAKSRGRKVINVI